MNESKTVLRPGSDALRLALGTLTALPVPAPREVTRSTARGAMLSAPLAGLILIALPAVVVLLLRPWDRPALALPVAVLLVALVALQTRGFHLDGLADTVDGLTASYDRERALAVMRTGDVGPAGATALVLVLLLQACSLGSLLTSPSGAVLAGVGVVASRVALTWACVGGRPARTSGLGAAVVGAVPAWAAGAVTAAIAILAAAPAATSGVPVWGGPLLVAVALATTAGVRHVATRRLGGLTGDVLGATVEIASAGCLFVGALVVAW